MAILNLLGKALKPSEPTKHMQGPQYASTLEDTMAKVQPKWRQLLTRCNLKAKIAATLRKKPKSVRLTLMEVDMHDLKDTILEQRRLDSSQNELVVRLDAIDSKVNYVRSELRILVARMEKVADEKKPGFEDRLIKIQEAIQGGVVQTLEDLRKCIGSQLHSSTATTK